jgi:hypothetical protein
MAKSSVLVNQFTRPRLQAIREAAARADAELSVKALDVRSSRTRRNSELTGDLFVRITACEMRQNLLHPLRDMQWGCCRLGDK